MIIQKNNDEISTPILRKAQFLLQQLIEIGVGYLSLERAVGTFWGGESQRLKIANGRPFRHKCTNNSLADVSVNHIVAQ
ncbi:MAG: hypothetical protein PHG06_08970 [Parabacteroides sp.]|nr:hypothetical protein [Parabacteroides sp.]